MSLIFIIPLFHTWKIDGCVGAAEVYTVEYGIAGRLRRFGFLDYELGIDVFQPYVEFSILEYVSQAAVADFHGSLK